MTCSAGPGHLDWIAGFSETLRAVRGSAGAPALPIYGRCQRPDQAVRSDAWPHRDDPTLVDRVSTAFLVDRFSTTFPRP